MRCGFSITSRINKTSEGKINHQDSGALRLCGVVIQHYVKKKSYSQSHEAKKYLHQPGIEPGSVPWQGTILPLDHWCFDERSVHSLLLDMNNTAAASPTTVSVRITDHIFLDLRLMLLLSLLKATA